MKLYEYQKLSEARTRISAEKRLQDRLREIAAKMKTASAREQKQLSRELDKLLGTRAEESPDPDLEEFQDEDDDS